MVTGCAGFEPLEAHAGTVSDIKLPGVVLFLCVSNEQCKNERDIQREMLAFRNEWICLFLCGECRTSEMEQSEIELYTANIVTYLWEFNHKRTLVRIKRLKTKKL